MRDWENIAKGLELDLSPAARESLVGLEKTLLGLRGLIDWREEPILAFDADTPSDPEPEPGQGLEP
jgi:hypothetical protein